MSLRKLFTGAAVAAALAGTVVAESAAAAPAYAPVAASIDASEGDHIGSSFSLLGVLFVVVAITAAGIVISQESP